MGMLLARRGQSGEKVGKGQAGRALRAAAVLVALSGAGALPGAGAPPATWAQWR